jgi:arsenite methyltransferase
MPSLPVLRTLLRELTTLERSHRVPEPDLVMDDPAKVAAYYKAGEVGGVMAPVYLFHGANACEVIKPGALVVDLACGPANQLAMIAGLNPQTRFVGLDLSEPMLARAHAVVRESGLSNVEFCRTDIADLQQFSDRSVDAVISTMAMHHLPTLEHLKRTFREIGRVLKPDGGLYIADFGRLKSGRSIRYFAHQYADRQPELFTLDYLYSLRAAFSVADFRLAGRVLQPLARLYTTFLSPYMVAFKSVARRSKDPLLRQQLQDLRAALPQHHQKDLRDLITFFGLGGLRCPLLQ